MYGVKIRVKDNDHVMTFWFDSIEARDTQLNFYSKDAYEIEEFLGDQMELILDTREG